ncbi:MAG: hypothetical protein EXS51_00025 [Candidatus Taylorbacteria bacterium]|nr:hypothetical protein [Candidatus Taylorbacteria bacterium]
MWPLLKQDVGLKKTERILLPKSPAAAPDPSGIISVYTDTDKDGLSAWEEVLYRTDPNNPDTDADGTLDGNEVQSRRDPTKKGMDQRTDVTEKILAPYYTLSFSPFAKTQDVAAPKTADAPPPVEQDETAEQKALHTYGNEAGTLILFYLQKGKLEYEVFTEATQNPSETSIARLSALSETYRTVSEKLEAIRAPSPVEMYHTALTKSYTALSKGVRELVAEQKDFTLQAQSFLDHYNDAAIAAAQAFSNLMQSFTKARIRFGPEEPGAIFSF